MPRTWRARLQLVGGLVLILVAAWIVVTGGSGDPPAGGSERSTAVSSAADPGPSPSAAPGSGSSGDPTPDSGLATIAESELPPEGRETLELIRTDGPFPHDRDGVTFFNREGILPSQERGYYSEYTVPTPGEDDRGARRIVGGQDGDRYYTDDHYASFRQIEEGQ